MIMMGMLLMIGGCTSMKNKSNDSKNSSSNKDELKSPTLTAPKVRKIWVPEKIEGDKFIEGHYMWILEKTTSWSQ
jgi:hypothetical protein